MAARYGRPTSPSNIRALRQMAIALLATACLPGCAAKPGDNARADTPVEIRLGYFANLTHAQALLGVASGEFANAVSPHTLTTRVFNAGPSAIEALFAGEVDLCYIGPGPALSGFEKSRGEALRVVAGAAANGVVIVASPNSAIQSMSDLAGKRIATPQMGNTQDIAARHYVIHELKQPNADNILAIPNAEQVAMMSRGQIDAAWAPEPWGERLVQEAGGRIIMEERELWPNKTFVLTVVIARTEFLQQHPDVVQRLLGAHAQWTTRLQNDAPSYLLQVEQAMFDLTGKRLASSVLGNAMSRISFTNDPMQETFAAISRWSLDLGFSKAKPDLAKLVDTQLLHQAVEATAASAPQPGGVRQ